MPVKGRDAIVLLLEQEMGYQEFTAAEEQELKRRARGYYQFLRRKGLSKREVRKRCDRIRAAARWELEHDWWELFLVSPKRNESQFALECNIYDTERLSLGEIWDQEVAAEKQWEVKITELAARNEDGYWERWSIATEHMAGMELLVAQLEEKGKLQREDTRLVAILGRKLNQLRFGEQTKRIVAFPHHDPEKRTGGCVEFKTVEQRLSVNRDGIYISATAWKKMRNRLNALMGSPARYPVTVREKREPLDALEVAVYGLHLDGTSS